jgi:membrane protease YdiL (CAAX protease family)
MGKLISINQDNKIVVFILFIMLLATFFLSTIPSMQIPAFLYGFLVLIGLFIYTNPVLQRYTIGIPTKGLFRAILIGGFIGFVIIIVPKIGLSIGVPFVPTSLESNLKWVIICIFAPFIEEIATRGALLGFMLYLQSKNKTPSKKVLWIAIILQAVFFMIIHATAYSQGWYSAPTIGGALNQLSAVSASLISAGIFGILMGYLVTRKGINSLAVSITAHYVVNQFIFIQLYSLFI